MKSLKNSHNTINIKISLPENIFEISSSEPKKRDMPELPVFKPMIKLEPSPFPPMSIDQDASVIFGKILESTATEIYRKAYRFAAEKGKNAIEVGDIESAVHEILE
jgi:histone H3/H4